MKPEEKLNGEFPQVNPSRHNSAKSAEVISFFPLAWCPTGHFFMPSFSISVRSNIDRVLDEMQGVGKEIQEKATVRALNKMADQGKTQAARAIRDAGYGIKVNVIKSQLRVQYAAPGRLVAKITASGRPIPLMQYGARAVKQGVTVNVLQGRRLIQGAFIARMPNGHVGVYVREAGARHKKVMQGGKASWHALPIRQLFGPSVPDALANAAVQSAMQQIIEERFPKLLEHEAKYLISRK